MEPRTAGGHDPRHLAVDTLIRSHRPLHHPQSGTDHRAVMSFPQLRGILRRPEQRRRARRPRLQILTPQRPQPSSLLTPPIIPTHTPTVDLSPIDF